MTNKLLSDFENDQIVAYDNWGLLLWDIAKKLQSFINRYFPQNYKKTGNYKKKGRAR